MYKDVDGIGHSALHSTYVDTLYVLSVDNFHGQVSDEA